MRIGVVGLGRMGSLHVSTLASLDEVCAVVVSDAVPKRAARVARELGLESAAGVDALLRRGVDALVVAVSTGALPSVLRRGLEAGLPCFCEKPVADSLPALLELAAVAQTVDVPVQVGFQRRFDAGYRRAREAVASGELGFVHTVRANTNDVAPPAPAYVATSGGILRDCNIHDFDALRYVTGAEVLTAYAAGANPGAAFFAEADDVATSVAVLTMANDVLATVSATRYNGAGHDVRMEVMGERSTLAVGLDGSLAMASAEPSGGLGLGTPSHSFVDRFRTAYAAELAAFIEVVRGTQRPAATLQDAVQAFRIAEACTISRREHRPVRVEEIPENAAPLALSGTSEAVRR